MRRTYWMSVEQICTIIAALMLASCVRVQAQFSVEQPFFFQQQAVSGPITLNGLVGGIMSQWVWNDAATNGSDITTWTARYSSNNLSWPQNTRTKPVGYATGMVWGVSSSLTNPPPNHSSSNWAYGYILYLKAQPNLYAQLGCYRYSGVYGFGFNAGKYYFSHGSPVSHTSVLDTNQWYDIVTTVGNVTNALQTFTNGVWSIGNSPYSPSPDPVNCIGLGTPDYDNQAFVGSIKEYIIWTNGIGSLGASNFHFYRTNFYGP